MRTTLPILCSLLLLALPALSQDLLQTHPPEPWSVGGWAGYGFGTLRGSWAVDPVRGIVPGGDCGSFEEGSASQLAGALGVERLLGQTTRLRIVSDFHWLQGTMRYPCVDVAETRLPDGSLARAETEFVADVEMVTASVRALFAVAPFEAPLVLAAGPYLSWRFGGNYSAREEVRSPREASFVSGGQVRPQGMGDFAGTTLGGGLAASVRFEAAAGPHLMLVPELDLRLALFDDVPEAQLAHDAAIFWLGLQYRFPAESDPTPLEAGSAAPFPAELTMRSSREPHDTLVVSERRVIATRLDPLLPYLFFDSGSAALPDRYLLRTAAETGTFHESNLGDTTAVALYYNVLDIVGERLRRQRDAVITVSASAPDAEGGATAALAGARAESVVRYLNGTWGIERNRMRVEARALPATPSSVDSPEGMAENRRVEISSDHYEITAPILRSDTTTTVEIPAVDLAARTGRIDPGAQWQMSLRGSRPLAMRSGSGEPPELWTVELETKDARELRTTAQLDAAITFGPEGPVGSARASLPLVYRQIREVESGAGYYSLILFDFDSSELRAEHRRTIALVNERIAGSRAVRVRGYTDRLGEADHNAALSRDRAARVAAELAVKAEAIEGLGESVPLYDNSLPEGRFYSRCVTIESR